MKKMVKTQTRVAIVGARGYSGLELARLLLKHPEVEFKACFATSEFQLGDLLSQPAAQKVQGFAIDRLLPMAQELDVVFLATPLATSMDLAPKLLELGLRVIDLSGAFRLQAGDIAETYLQWYGVQHVSTKWVADAHYGLVPWSKPKSNVRLISNPGCFATAILMGLLPLLKNGLIDPTSVVIDAKSGTTGAGKKPEERLLHAEVAEGCTPYRIGRHQHLPEVQQFAKVFGNADIEPHFTTHLMNVRRGIVAGLYAKLLPGETSQIANRIASAFADAYVEDPLVEVTELTAANESSVLNLRRVVGTARTRIAYHATGDKLYVFVMIDNLMKGAASQAVENFNCLIGLPAWSTLVDMEGSI
jgi:N-acetyl-gamma-glutamyl-phosphate reductase